MKIGDIFEDGGRKYKVVGENEAGLISEVITEEEKVEEAPKRRRKTESAE